MPGITCDPTRVERNCEAAAMLLKAMANDKRLRILCSLERGEFSVSELEKVVELSQSALSQHLARLRRDGLVCTRRDAQTIYYSIKNKAVTDILLCLKSIFEHPTEETLQLISTILQSSDLCADDPCSEPEAH